MQNNGTIPETYTNLYTVIEILEKHKADIKLIESVKTAQKYLLSLELMAIASNKEA